MNNLNWGRKKQINKNDPSKNEMSDSFIKILAIGTVICLASTVLFYDMTPKYTTVSAATNENGNSTEENAAADPFGYFNGEWNLWEFIGDSFSSLLP